MGPFLRLFADGKVVEIVPGMRFVVRISPGDKPNTIWIIEPGKSSREPLLVINDLPRGLNQRRGRESMEVNDFIRSLILYQGFSYQLERKERVEDMKAGVPDRSIGTYVVIGPAED